MSNAHKPKYLKQYPPTPWEQDTAEVFAMVKSTPNRRTDVDKMTIVLEDEKMYLTYPTPAKSEVAAAICTALVFLLAVAVLVAALAAPSIGTRLLTFCTTTLLATAIISNMKGEKKNAQH